MPTAPSSLTARGPKYMPPISSRTTMTSTPRSSTEGFRGLASASSGYMTAGRGCVEPERRAYAEQTFFGTVVRRLSVPLGSAHGAEQHSVRFLARVHRFTRQGTPNLSMAQPPISL